MQGVLTGEGVGLLEGFSHSSRNFRDCRDTQNAQVENGIV